MPIIGGRQVGVRGLGFQGAGKPNAPTINSVTRASDTSVTITYTLGANNGAPITTIEFTSSPSTGGSLTIIPSSGSNLTIDSAFTGTSTVINNRTYYLGQAFTNGISSPEVRKHSGNIIYVDNRPSITRSSNQKEEPVAAEFDARVIASGLPAAIEVLPKSPDVITVSQVRDSPSENV